MHTVLKQVYNISIYSYLRCKRSTFPPHPTPKDFFSAALKYAKTYLVNSLKKYFRDKIDLQPPFVYGPTAPTSFYCFLVQKLTEL